MIEITSQNRICGIRYKLRKTRFRTDVGKYWFTSRVVNDWNRLGRHVVSAESVGNFKKRLDECMERSIGEKRGCLHIGH